MTTDSAPQVVYPLGRSALLGCAIVALWMAGAVVCCYWIYSAPASDLRMLLLAGAVMLVGGAALRGWYTSPVGHLTWDGQCWRWQSAGYVAGESALQLVGWIDLQRMLWLRLENPAGASLWLWAERSALPYRWMDLRRAVYCSAGARNLPLTATL